MVAYKSIVLDGIKIFYREAGTPEKPSFLLLHGFPSASHMFRDLMPLLQKDFHLIASDYPGFGQSDAPERRVRMLFVVWNSFLMLQSDRPVMSAWL